MSAAQDTIASLRDDGTEIITIGAVMLSLAVSAVLLRFLAKSQIEKKFGLDDVLIGIALVSYSTAESLVLRGQYHSSRPMDGIQCCSRRY